MYVISNVLNTALEEAGYSYRKCIIGFGERGYILIDRGNEIVSTLLEVCRKEGILSAYYSGIGGCSDVEMQVFIPERGAFETEEVEGTLELVSLMGNVVSDDSDQLFDHTHALFTWIEGGEHRSISGHMKSSTVLYTAEIELRPVTGGVIRRQYDPETGTGFWRF